jgi:hypothetical protein
MIGVGESYFFLGDDGFGVMTARRPLLSVRSVLFIAKKSRSQWLRHSYRRPR